MIRSRPKAADGNASLGQGVDTRPIARPAARSAYLVIALLMQQLCVSTVNAADNRPLERSVNAGASNAAFAQQILKAHNRLRCLHGAPPLQWSNAVADYAQRWVDKAGFQHSDSYNAPVGPMGENLFGTTGALSGDEAAQAWYSESEGYDYGREGPSSSGHFTAMIWKDARYLGCGRAGGTLSCNYWPGPAPDSCAIPNMGGCYTKQVRPVSRSAQDCR
jgi:hypothetical protein